MTTPQSPIGSRRRLGAELRRLRAKAGLTLDEVAVRMTCSTSKISRLETGKGIPKVPDVRELMRIYGVSADAERDMLLRLVREGREHGWWEPLTEGLQQDGFAANDPAARFAGLETEARAVSGFEIVVVHGLLQTPDYARVMLDTIVGDSGEVDRRLELRRRRQEALVRPVAPLRLSVVLDESVLWRRVGTPAVMEQQLRHLVEMSERPNVEIRVLPLDAGFLAGHVGSFGILDIPAAAGADVAYVESFTGISYMETVAEVANMRAVLDDLREHAYDIGVTREVISRWRNVHRRREKGPTG